MLDLSADRLEGCRLREEKVEKKLLEMSVHWKLWCDGKSHWVNPANVSSWGLQRIEAGACNCVKGAEGDDAEGKAGKDPAPQSPHDRLVYGPGPRD